MDPGQTLRKKRRMTDEEVEDTTIPSGSRARTGRNKEERGKDTDGNPPEKEGGQGRNGEEGDT